jgi:hypothetical protein
MFFFLGIWNGLGEIRAHKLRSALTITCVMLGVASLVLIAGFISGLFYNWESWEREFGWNEQVTVYQRRAPDTDAKIRDPAPPWKTPLPCNGFAGMRWRSPPNVPATEASATPVEPPTPT